jgi:hypothetical protein
MSAIFVPVSRTNIRIKRKPQPSIEIGCIFRYSGSQNRLKNYLLIHAVNPAFSNLKDANGKPRIADDMVVAEVLVPENGFVDYCVFWVEKTALRVPSEAEYSKLLSKMRIS